MIGVRFCENSLKLPVIERTILPQRKAIPPASYIPVGLRHADHQNVGRCQGRIQRPLIFSPLLLAATLADDFNHEIRLSSIRVLAKYNLIAWRLEIKHIRWRCWHFQMAGSASPVQVHP
jgi:hypothetical protein